MMALLTDYQAPHRRYTNYVSGGFHLSPGFTNPDDYKVIKSKSYEVIKS